MRKLICLLLSVLLFHFSYGQEAIDLNFAKQLIRNVITEGNLPELKINFKRDSKLGSEGYRIKLLNSNKVTIYGGDGKGLLYGGIEVAEQLQLFGKVSDTKGEPYIAKRGLKFNIPLDARTPSYDDSGDAAQKNILEMLNWEFWEEFINNMAIHKYNTLTLWNPHPFPSMIKLPDYPEIALDDVKVTTLTPIGRENEWGDPQLVTKNVMANLKTVKEITIENKIKFWKRVMAHAKSRGIDIYWITWNICPNSVAVPVEPYHKTFGIKLWEEQPGKHGITHQMNNPKTVAYYRDAVKTFLLTYPDVKGIGVTAGEYMPETWDGYNREQWLWETYGLGILDAKKEQVDREVTFIHRVWYSDMDQIMNYFKAYPDPFQVSFKYAKARLYSSPEPPFAKAHIAAMEPYGLQSWWNLRNDDIFVYRWGDANYVRNFLKFFPKEETAGYYYGSDGYVWGKEFISKSPKLSGELEIKKHWYNFMLWGRMGYNPDLSNEVLIAKIGEQYENIPSKELFDLWQTASRIIPQVNTFHWRNWDHMWSVESCSARPVLGGFRTVTDFINNPTMEGSNILNPAEYVRRKVNKIGNNSISLIEIIKRLRSLSQESIAGVERLNDLKNISEESKALLGDIAAMGHLGNYYAAKIEAAVYLAFYKESKDKKRKSEAVILMEDALQHWMKYSETSQEHYKPQMLARVNILDWNALINEAKEDIRVAKDFKP